MQGRGGFLLQGLGNIPADPLIDPVKPLNPPELVPGVPHTQSG